MTAQYILAIDQGTTSTRAIAFDSRLRPIATAASKLTTSHPSAGWVEQDPDEILASVVETVALVVAEVGGHAQVAAAGLANQGETVVAWDAETGRALAPAVSWQCRRSLPIVERLRAAGLEGAIRSRSGLPLDPYFSAGKMTWLLEQDEAVGAAARRGTMRLGTVDAWITACLDGGDARTDPSTASRTQLFDLASGDWDEELLAWFGVPRECLPRIVRSAGPLGRLSHSAWGGDLPLYAMACDQQAALAGHAAFEPGTVKATYGTGVFVLANAGERSKAGPDLEVSAAWVLPDGARPLVLQGGVFTAGALIDWLSQLGLLAQAADTDDAARSVPDAGGVRILPALAGLGTPWWRPEARGVIAGLTGSTRPGHIVRAALDGIAQAVTDVVDAMSSHLGRQPTHLRVDGGLTASRFLMQRQADLLGLDVHVATETESTALGVAGLAGIGAGLLNAATIDRANPVRERIKPSISASERRGERVGWREFVRTAVDLRGPPEAS